MSEQATHLPQGWYRLTLEKIASSITSGGTPTSGSPRYYVPSGGLPFAKTEDLTASKNKYLFDCGLEISDAALKESAAKKYPVGTILISMYGTIGLTKVTARELSANQALCALIPPLSCSTDYLYHYLDYSRLDWLRFSGQTTQANINGGAVRAKEVLLPPRKEQEGIAQVLDTLDTAIYETEAIIAKLKAVKQGLLHDLLTRGIAANGELRPPQAEAPHLYEDSLLGWIPKEWELSTVGEQFEIQLGKMLDGQKNAGVLKPYVGNKAVQWDRVDLGEVQQVRLSKSDLIRFRLQKGDLLVCEGGDVGRAAIWDNDLDECYYQKALHRLRPLRGYHPRLMLETLRYLMGRDALSEYISRTSIAHLTQEKLARVPLPTPKVDEQERMVAEILTSKQRLETEESQLQKLRLLKSGLMDDLLTGRVRVTPLLAEAAQQQGSA